MRHLGQAELDAGDVLGDCFDAHAERLRRVEQACAVHVHGQALRARMRVPSECSTPQASAPRHVLHHVHRKHAPVMGCGIVRRNTRSARACLSFRGLSGQ